MNARRALAVLGVGLGLCNCMGSGWPNPAGDAAYAVTQVFLGPFSGPELSDCSLPADPGEEPAGLTQRRDGGTCTATAADGACAACVTAHCCAESIACFSEGTCTCLMARRTGIPWPESVPCGAQDAAYTAEDACLTAHCAQECLAPGTK